MDFTNLTADKNIWLNKHYTPGRGGNKIDRILVHHNAGVNRSTQDLYNGWQTRQASAHYQVEMNGTIGQLVHDADTAWHAGNFAVNQTSIGIEHANSGGAAQGWPISEATRESGAHLVAAICRYYGLGRPQWGVNVFPHRAYQSTECPVQLATTYRAAFMARAQAWYDEMTGAQAPTVTVVPATAAPAAPAAAKSDDIDVDGWWGGSTTLKLQEVLDTPKDSTVSSQDAGRKGILEACTSGWEFVPAGQAEGSQLITAMQTRMGITADGIAGPGFVNALEARFGFAPDNHLDGPSNTVKAMQTSLNAGRF